MSCDLLLSETAVILYLLGSSGHMHLPKPSSASYSSALAWLATLEQDLFYSRRPFLVYQTKRFQIDVRNAYVQHEACNYFFKMVSFYSQQVTVAVLSLAVAAWAVPQEGYNYPKPGDVALSSGSATGGGQVSSGSGQFSAGAGQYASGSGQFGTGSAGQFGTGSGQFGTGGGQFGTGSGPAQYPSAPAQYTFQWDVNDQLSGNFYGHQEQREGANTQGKYYVQLPDGRRLVVEYFADSTGYHPTITFEGEAQFPSGPSQGAGGQGYGQGGVRPGQGFPQTGPWPNQGVGSGQGQSPSQSYLPPSK
ncbi:pro-resilin-like [Penaeus monodon]|uniref:pro-resilin-like n=1 Tax=Penaeus monodon TaxID=6687 RepID=UPI0018A77E81|nr:pro-resilin-like [Penaeus monodon]